RFGDCLDDARPLFLLAPAQFLLQRFESLVRHRDLVHSLTFLPFTVGPSGDVTQKENGSSDRTDETVSPRIQFNIAMFSGFSRPKSLEPENNAAPLAMP